MKQLRSKVSDEFKMQASKLVCEQITRLGYFRKAQHIGLYDAIKQEIDLSYLRQAAVKQRKQCYYPKINPDKSLTFLPVTKDSAFAKNTYGILEPLTETGALATYLELDLIIMPVVAFDSACTRLGMGLGCYDRTLNTQSKALLLGAAYSFQHMDYLFAESWDVPLDAVVTPQKIYWR